MASSQHRCVFVGNIPYDTSEEQLIEILKEVGPVVSFRLVIDRETGKPKGYGFCEYKDEETALSARRNLQGYEINGRQLRVDFAENDKGLDRNREQGRGGPGLAANNDPSKQIGGPATYGEAVPHQPIGLQSAVSAAAVVAGALGGTQASLNSNQNGMQNQSALANDPLTLHLAKMSRSQLNGVMSELKMMGTRNKELARQLLLGRPQLAKALFQAQIMLGMVAPQVLQMPNIRQVPAHTPTQLPMQPRVQALPQSTLPGQPGASIPSAQAHSTANMAIRPHLQMSGSSSLNQQMQPSLLQQQLGPVPASNPGQNARMLFPNANVHANVLSRPQLSNKGYQPPQSMPLGIPDTNAEKPNTLHTSSESMPRPPKLARLDDGRSTAFPTVTRPSQVSGPTIQYSENQNPQPQQLAPEMESVLLQQVMSLTPEQLSSLPPEQQQQVIQLQQLLRRDQS